MLDVVNLIHAKHLHVKLRCQHVVLESNLTELLAGLQTLGNCFFFCFCLSSVYLASVMSIVSFRNLRMESLTMFECFDHKIHPTLSTDQQKEDSIYCWMGLNQTSFYTKPCYATTVFKDLKKENHEYYFNIYSQGFASPYPKPSQHTDLTSHRSQLQFFPDVSQPALENCTLSSYIVLNHTK